MIVLDANILIRAVLGARVFAILDQYIGLIDFAAPDTAWREAAEHLHESGETSSAC